MSYLTIQAAADAVGVCPATLRAYERDGDVVVSRDTVGRRIYTEADVKRAGKVKQQRERARRQAGVEGLTRYRLGRV